MAQKKLGFVIYRGPSLIDGAPIVCVVLMGKSTNDKTGAMIQTYILREDIAPLEAIRTRADVSICGTCRHRGALPVVHGASLPADRTCYVNVGQGATGVWRALQRGRYAEDIGAHQAAQAAAGRPVRMGTYGDPAALPADVWARLVSLASMHTGYTHAWENSALSEAQRSAIGALCMASVDTEEEAHRARALGFRTFRVRTKEEALLPLEMPCPASEEAGHAVQCKDCGACDGTKRGARKAMPVIIAHGFLASRFKASGIRTQ